jgi:hypothetical protein
VDPHPYFDLMERNDPCPCGSGRKFKRCWSPSAAAVHPPPASLTLAEPPLSARHPKCAFRDLGACSTDGSLEHYVSDEVQATLREALLACLTPEGKREFESQPSLVEIAPARVLCTRHNNALSALDAVATHLARGLCSVSLAMLSGALLRGWPKWTLVNGHDVERYMVKMLIGAAAAGLPGIGPWRMPRNIATATQFQVRVLQGVESLRRPNGLYVKASSDLETGGQVTNRVPDLGVRPLFESDASALAGVLFRIFGIDLVLWCSEQGTAPRQDLGDLAYRPTTVDTQSKTSHVATLLAWERHFEHRLVRFRSVETLHSAFDYADPTWHNLAINRAPPRRTKRRDRSD